MNNYDICPIKFYKFITTLGSNHVKNYFIKKNTLSASHICTHFCITHPSV